MATDRGSIDRWQIDAHRVLGELLAASREHDLPPLAWTLATTGALTGEASGRVAVHAWAAHLGATVTETARDDGRVSLYAPFSIDGERRGALRAELWPESGESDL